MKDILISRDSKGKVRIVDISCDWNETLRAYVIERKTSQLGGKITEQPLIEINKGKAKRTVTEQANLEYNSHIKKYLDKGYKNISDFGYSSLNDFNPDDVLPKEVTDANGARKPMLAKKYDEVATSTFEKPHWASKKLDGVRCMIRNDNGILKTSSRGGGDYDIPAAYILQDPYLIQLFKNSPDCVLDGELYIHGKPLPYISGLCRKITLEEAHKELIYCVYDLAIPDISFLERLNSLNILKDETFVDSDKIEIQEHIETTSWTDIKKLHDKWVSEGYEGCVIRNPNKEYGYGKKDNRMIKIKEFEDDEFEILGINEGLRDEDFSFLMKCNAGTFGAKPVGDRALRQEYRDNIDNLIGKKGTVKFFGLTPDGIPNLPIFKYIRYGDDIE